MSRFRKLSHAIWHCQYHLVWVPKYRYRVLECKVGEAVRRCIMVFSEQKHCDVVELNVQKDHVHLLIMVPPKLSISDMVGILKGRSAIRIFKQFHRLRSQDLLGQLFLGSRLLR